MVVVWCVYGMLWLMMDGGMAERERQVVQACRLRLHVHDW
jgi:hypothetical protein